MATPAAGSSNLKPVATSAHEKCSGIRVSTTAASSVISVNKPTFIIASRSMR